MAGLAFVVCEALDGGEWQAEARFLVRNASSLLELLQASNLDGRGLPANASATVQTDLLFEEGRVSDQTCVTFSDLPRLTLPAALEDYPRMAAWDGFLRGLEHSGRPSRLLIWFVW